MTAEELESGKEFGRYKDYDGDGVPPRTLPGTHPSKGAYFTRGTSRDPYARYSEAGPDYQYNMQRLQTKFEHAKKLVPQPLLTPAKHPARFGCLYYGSPRPSMASAPPPQRPRPPLRPTGSKSRTPWAKRSRRAKKRKKKPPRKTPRPRRRPASRTPPRDRNKRASA